MHQLMQDLFPICRSITGEGVRQTLRRIQDVIPVKTYEVPSGTKVFDWTIPKEWNIFDAYVEDMNGNNVIDFQINNLHIVGYSVPTDKIVTLEELNEHLYSLPEQPEAIPYVTSYYNETWGFCVSHNERQKLTEEKYHVVIKSTLDAGNLTYGEYIIPGESDKEVFLSTYICHPSLANNELSGPVVLSYIGKWLASKPRRYTYRMIFVPETIGAITYLSRNLQELKSRVVAGFNLTCLGDESGYSYIASRYGNSYADKVANNILSTCYPDFIQYSFLDRGSDESQYCSPGVDLPLVTLCRRKFGSYPQYHTSLDNLDFVTPKALSESYQLIKKCLIAVEKNKKYQINCFCEPQLGKRGLYPTVSFLNSAAPVKTMLDFITYADGDNDLIDISNRLNKPLDDLFPVVKTLLDAGLLSTLD
ncbi:MAG: DUF4910 domain-containing protein [Desulfovibrionaceae bacterium]|nr:DUF4910 domain-containing protein [Desulfovibrionaceae bacterium]MBF0512651.1 DUF4910 domain-containing protein [Desulfovibrionaceae bacterium]